MLLQGQTQTIAHPLSGTVADWVGLLPLIPLLGFVLNGIISLATSYRRGPGDPTAAGAHHAIGGDHASAEAEHDEHAASAPPLGWLVSIIGPAVLAIAFALAAAIFGVMLGAHIESPFIKTYFSWMPVGDLELAWSFQLDQLSMLMTLIITGVGFLIHVFSVGYMREDRGYARYFAYLNLFVAFMLVLVLGASYPVMFVGWEGVGLCSYLLIGFWFNDKVNADAGKKAFIVNRIGDFGFLIAMFMLYANLNALDFVGVAAAAPSLQFGGPLVTAICLFFFLGCAGKSAQIPLYVWLPDAMAGPTPVSALIHAATMVTAGVYLTARSGFLFSLAPVACLTVALIGAITAFFAATIGLKQWDIKKVLAYSTVSQLGYMFVAVGAGAYVSGLFHLMTHAFFKALLFLGSGSVIYAMHAAYHHTHSHEDAQDMRNMGGMRKFLPVTFVLMWIATLAISGIPPFSGFFSKDEILASVFARAQDSVLAQASWLGIPGSGLLYFIYALGLAAALLTAIYMTRMMIYTFHGPNRTGEEERKHLSDAPWVMTVPLVVLGILSLAGGWLNLPHFLPVGPPALLEHWLEPVVGPAAAAISAGGPALPEGQTEYMLIGAAILIAIAGIAFAFVRLDPKKLVPAREATPERGAGRVLLDKYYVDEAYDAVVVRPTVGVARNVLWRGVDAGIIDGLFVNGSAWFARGVGWIGSQFQSGQTGTYAWGFVIGVLLLLSAFTLR